MTYEFEGKRWELVFTHRAKVTIDRDGRPIPREGTELMIREAGKDALKKVRWLGFAVVNPSDAYSREKGRGMAIKNTYRDTDMGYEEYILLRRAYFLRRRKTTAARRQTRAFNKEIGKILADADLPLEARQSAGTLRAFFATLNHAKKTPA